MEISLVQAPPKYDLRVTEAELLWLMHYVQNGIPGETSKDAQMREVLYKTIHNFVHAPRAR